MENINQYMGIIGTVIGTTLGFLLSSIKEYFKNKGKVYYDFTNLKKEYEGINELNETTHDENINNLHDVDYIIYHLNARIINYSNQTKILKDIKIKFVSNKAELETIPRVFSHKVANVFNEFKDLTLLTFNPYETKEIELTTSIKIDNINEIDYDSIYFKAKNIRGKNIEVKIN